jgi:hypothetical protein
MEAGVHNSQRLVPMLSQLEPVLTFPPYFPNIHSNIILPSMPRSSEWFFPTYFPNKILNAFTLIIVRPDISVDISARLQNHTSLVIVSKIRTCSLAQTSISKIYEVVPPFSGPCTVHQRHDK